LTLIIVRFELTVLAGLQPRTVHRIEMDDGFVDVEKLGMKNSVIKFNGPQSPAMHCKAQLFSHVAKRLR